MVMNGYQIIDFRGLNFTDEIIEQGQAFYVENIYSQIEGAVKTTMIKGISISKSTAAIFSPFYSSEGVFYSDVQIGKDKFVLSVDDWDDVVVTKVVEPEPGGDDIIHISPNYYNTWELADPIRGVEIGPDTKSYRATVTIAEEDWLWVQQDFGLTFRLYTPDGERHEIAYPYMYKGQPCVFDFSTPWASNVFDEVRATLTTGAVSDDNIGTAKIVIEEI